MDPSLPDDGTLDPESKHQTSATDNRGHNMDAPSDVQAPAVSDHGGRYGAAPQIWSALRYCLKEVAKNPLLDYPSSMALYGMEPDATLLTHAVFSTNFALGNDSTKVFTRGDDDPATLALAASGARRVPAESIEMCTLPEATQTLELIRPFSEKDDLFHVYELPLRRVAQGSLKHEWPSGARLGLTASGAWSNRVTDQQQPRLPPLLRKVNWRELLHILQASLQIGLPTSVNTDGKLGWALYAYMSTEILMDRCGGARSLLLRAQGDLFEVFGCP